MLQGKTSLLYSRAWLIENKRRTKVDRPFKLYWTMEDLLIDAEDKLPKIYFNRQTGILSLTGRCIPENSFKFFTPLLEWIDEYADSPNDETVIDVFLDYFNTSSSKYLLDLFKQVELIHLSGKTKMKVIWRHEGDDLDMLEAGTTYASMVNAPFEMVVMKD